MSNDYAWLTAGFDRIEGQVLDSSGNIAGTSGTVATGAVGSAGFRIIGGKSANAAVPPPVVTPVTGDDAYLAGFVFPSNAARTFQLKAAVQDLNVQQYLGSGNAIAVGLSEVGFLDVNPFTPINVALILVSQAKSQTPGNVGTGIWSGVIIPKAVGIPTGKETFQERAEGVMNFTFVFSQADRFPWGETFKTSTHGVSLASILPWSANNRKSFHRFSGDGATTAFGPLQYTPASTSLNDVVVYVNGYRRTANVTVSTTNKTITFSVAPLVNDIIAVYYDYVVTS